jgi:GrpB-like predicted nucleotidyltransferase (UPF0157 family)
VAAEYEALKQRLAREHRFDRETYTQAKNPFISQITDLALEMGYGSGGHSSERGHDPDS